MLYIVDARTIKRVNARTPKEAAELANLDGPVLTHVIEPATGESYVYYPPAHEATTCAIAAALKEALRVHALGWPPYLPSNVSDDKLRALLIYQRELIESLDRIVRETESDLSVARTRRA